MLDYLFESKHEQSLNLFFRIRGFSDERDDYLLFKSGKLIAFDYDKNLSMHILLILEELGFSQNDIGTYAYKNLIKKVVYMINDGVKEDKILMLLHQNHSQLYLDVARYELDMGVDTFHNEINMAISNIKSENINKKLLYSIFNNYQHLNYDIQAYVLAKYINDVNQLEQKNNKTLKKEYKL